MSNVTKQLKLLLEKLTGQVAPFANEVQQHDLQLFQEPKDGLGYSQLNEMLLLFGFDRITHAFFQFLLDGNTEYKSGEAFSSFEQLESGVRRFRELAVLLYGNVKFAFKSLSRDAEQLTSDLTTMKPLSEESFSERHHPLLQISPIQPEDAYLTGYLIERELADRLKKNPNDADIRLEKHRKEVVKRALENHVAYLASDHLDVYVATSMRMRHEFMTISRLASSIFSDGAVQKLNLRWFDPTQAYCPNRIDKGLSEALMLRRATCTIYLAQETDTLGKDSELASTLAQGKPVVAYIPEVTDGFFEQHIKLLSEPDPDKSVAILMLDQLKLFEPQAAWSDPEVRVWCENPSQSNEVVIRDRLRSQMKNHYDKRAKTLKESHPLGIQVNLETGVACGVLVVRTVQDCAELIRNIVLHRLEFNLEETDDCTVLREKISGCIFRVMTGDAMLTNTFWNFYLDPAE